MLPASDSSDHIAQSVTKREYKIDYWSMQHHYFSGCLLGSGTGQYCRELHSWLVKPAHKHVLEDKEMLVNAIQDTLERLFAAGWKTWELARLSSGVTL